MTGSVAVFVYRFTPRLRVAPGLDMGDPVVVPRFWRRPDAGAASTLSPSSPYAYVSSAPCASGMVFDVVPAHASIVVDGQIVGTVGAFCAETAPLTVPTGRHTIELRAPGWRSVVFTLQAVEGRVVPYRGALQEM